MFALEGDLRKATETAEGKARSLQESQRALAAVVAKLGGNFNPFLHHMVLHTNFYHHYTDFHCDFLQ